VSTIQAALDAAKEIGYPIILRSAFSLGGLGSGFAHDEEELRNLAAKSLSLSPQVLIEKSLKGWKEVEYEVVRDAADVSGQDAQRGDIADRRTSSSAATWRTLTPSEHIPETRSSLLLRRR
jgi:carbamoylphosphate synthase large subunit